MNARRSLALLISIAVALSLVAIFIALGLVADSAFELEAPALETATVSAPPPLPTHGETDFSSVEGALCIPANAERIIPSSVKIDSLGWLFVEIPGPEGCGQYRPYTFAGDQVVEGSEAQSISVANMAQSWLQQNLLNATDVTLLVDPLASTDAIMGLKPVYVIADGQFINYKLIRLGLAVLGPGAPSCASTFEKAQDDASLERKGVWEFWKP